MTQETTSGYRRWILGVDQKLRSIYTPKHLFLAILGLCIIIAIHVYFRGAISGDLSFFNIPWIEHLRLHGFASFKDNFYNYNPTYLYFLYIVGKLQIMPVLVDKIVSAIFDISLGLAVAFLVKRVTGRIPMATAAGILVLLLPEVFINSAWWGQVDASYTSCLVWAVYFMLRRKYTAVGIFFGIALAFKLQAGFFFPPLFLVLFFRRGLLRTLPFIVLAFFALYIPALLAGRSLVSLLSIYWAQAQQNPVMTANAPTVWGFRGDEWTDPFLLKAGLYGTAILVLALILFFARQSGWLPKRATSTTDVSPRFNARFSDARIVQMFALMGMLTVYFLPQMHERYFYSSVIFLFVALFTNGFFLFPLVIAQIANVINYLTYLNLDANTFLWISTPVMTAAVILTVWFYFSPPKQKELPPYMRFGYREDMNFTKTPLIES